MNFWLYLPFTKEVKYKKPICLLSKWKSNVLPKVCPDGVTVLFGERLGAKPVETHLRPDSFLFNSFTLYSIAVGGRLGEGSIWDFLARLAHGGFGGWWEKRILQKHWNRTFLYCLVDVEKSALEARNATVIALGSANLLVTECKSTAFPFIEMKLILPDLTSFITCFLNWLLFSCWSAHPGCFYNQPFYGCLFSLIVVTGYSLKSHFPLSLFFFASPAVLLECQALQKINS